MLSCVLFVQGACNQKTRLFLFNLFHLESRSLSQIISNFICFSQKVLHNLSNFPTLDSSRGYARRKKPVLPQQLHPQFHFCALKVSSLGVVAMIGDGYHQTSASHHRDQSFSLLTPHRVNDAPSLAQVKHTSSKYLCNFGHLHRLTLALRWGVYTSFELRSSKSVVLS